MFTINVLKREGVTPQNVFKILVLFKILVP